MLTLSATRQRPVSGLSAVSTLKLNGVDSDMNNTVQVRWHFADSADQVSKLRKCWQLLTSCQQFVSGRLVLLFPEGEEGVNGVNNPVVAI